MYRRTFVSVLDLSAFPIKTRSLSMITVNKNLSKVKYCSKGYFFSFNNLQTNNWQYFVRPEKFLFLAIPNLNVLAVRWSVKYSSSLNSPVFWASTAEEQK